jgi:hypothetical protein
VVRSLLLQMEQLGLTPPVSPTEPPAERLQSKERAADVNSGAVVKEQTQHRSSINEGSKADGGPKAVCVFHLFRY